MLLDLGKHRAGQPGKQRNIFQHSHTPIGVLLLHGTLRTQDGFKYVDCLI
jgi:hypothetical protein